MRTKYIFWLLSLFEVASWAQAAGGETGNGGGLIARDGNIITIGSSGLRLGLEPMTADEIPGMLNLIKNIQTLKIHGYRKTRILDAVLPSHERKPHDRESRERRYFKIKKEDLPALRYQQLIDVYAKMLKIDPQNLRLGALTSGKESYFLPEFFELQNESQQGAIIFHEASWILKPTAPYTEVVKAEMAMEKYLLQSNKCGYEPRLFQSLEYLLGNIRFDALIGAAECDLEQHKKSYSYEDVFGEKFLRFAFSQIDLFSGKLLLGEQGSIQDRHFLNPEGPRNYQNRTFNSVIARAEWKKHLLDSTLKYPKLHVYRELLNLQPRLALSVIAFTNAYIKGLPKHEWEMNLPDIRIFLVENFVLGKKLLMNLYINNPTVYDLEILNPKARSSLGYPERRVRATYETKDAGLFLDSSLGILQKTSLTEDNSAFSLSRRAPLLEEDQVATELRLEILEKNEASK